MLTHRVAAIVNSSETEGASTAILEAFGLGRPVIARNNIGNAALMEHERTGLLYRTPQEFRQCAERLLREPALVENLCAAARDHLHRHFSPELESMAYLQLLRAPEG